MYDDKKWLWHDSNLFGCRERCHSLHDAVCQSPYFRSSGWMKPSLTESYFTFKMTLIAYLSTSAWWRRSPSSLRNGCNPQPGVPVEYISGMLHSAHPSHNPHLLISNILYNIWQLKGDYGQLQRRQPCRGLRNRPCFLDGLNCPPSIWKSVAPILNGGHLSKCPFWCGVRKSFCKTAKNTFK